MSRTAMSKYSALSQLKNAGGYSSVTLLLGAHWGLWLALLAMITSMILLFSYLLLMEVEITSDELSGYGLVASARVLLSEPEKTISFDTGHKMAQQVNEQYQALVVPMQTTEPLKCRFFNHTSYMMEEEVMVDGYLESVDKKHYAWVANGEFTTVLHRLDMTASRPQFNLLQQKLNGEVEALGRFEVLEFAESAVKLALPQAMLGTLDELSFYYFTIYTNTGPVKTSQLGPLMYDRTSGYFMLLSEEDMPTVDVKLLATQQQLADFIDSIYQQHIPFLPGPAVEQLQLDTYEYSTQEKRYNNQLMLTSLIFDQQGAATAEHPSRAFFTGVLFRKLFPNPFDYKTLKISCARGAQLPLEQIVSVYGHYQLKAEVAQNPNQIFVTYPPATPSGAEQAPINGFLIKDLGQIRRAVMGLTKVLQQYDSDIKPQIIYANQSLRSYSLFILIIFATAMAMGAILLVLTLPFRRIMVPQLFLIKIYGGHYISALVVSCLLVFLLSVGAAWVFGGLIMQYINLFILAPYEVPLMRFEPRFFVSGSLIVLVIWLAVWGWSGVGIKKVVQQYGITSGG